MKVYLELSEVERLEKAATNLRDHLMIRLLFRTGCRISELLGLQLQDIDFVHGTVLIQHLKSRVRLACSMCGAGLGASHLFCPKCGGKIETKRTEERLHRRRRTLPIDRDSLELLKEYVQRGGLVTKGDKKLVFGVNRHRGWQIVKECAEKAGLPMLVNPESGKVHHVSPHRLRDSFSVHAVKLDDSGDGLRLLQEHLGHRSFNTTAKYRKISGKEHQDWYQRLWNKKD